VAVVERQRKESKMIRWLSSIGAVAALLSGPALAQSTPNNDGWAWAPGGMMFGGGIMMIVFWGGIIMFVVMLARMAMGGRNHSEHRHRSGQSPLETLQQRYARGEIEKQEYEDRRRTLAGG
jgi:putative membrane protein